MIKLILLLLLVSCAHKSDYNIINSEDHSLKNTYSRVPASIENKAKNEYTILLSKCYLDKNIEHANELRSLAVKYSNNFWYWTALGNCNKALNLDSKALTAFKRAMTLAESAKKREVTLSNLLSLSLKIKNEYMAQAYAQEISKSVIKNDITRYNLSLFHFQKANYQKTLEFIRSISKVGQNDIDVKVAKVKTLIALKRYSMAQKVLSKISAKYITRSDISILAAYLLIQTNNLKQAKELLNNIEHYKSDEKVIAVRYLNIIKAKLKIASKKDS
jgi:predicted Zn-dependent protease